MTGGQGGGIQKGRRDFISGALVGMAGGSLAAAVPNAVGATPGSRRKSKARLQGLHPEGAPAADVGYTPGILAEGQRLVFISGQGPRDLDADMETQLRQTLERIKILVEAAGGTMANVVMLRSYFVHLARDLPIYRKVRTEYLVKPYPASTAVGVPELAVAGLEIEIEALAVL